MNKFSAVKFNSKEEADSELNPILYSKFKFGCKDSAKDIGERLAYSLILSLVMKRPDVKKLKKAITDNVQIVVCTSPYQFIPTATFAMKDYFIRDFNEHLIQRGCNPVEEMKMYRKTSYKEDYGALSAKERLRLISNDEFYIDGNYLLDKFTLYLDDVRITGSHEKLIIQTLDNYNSNLRLRGMMAYYGELTNRKCDPSIENYLNYAAIKSLLDLDKIIKNNNFLPNTRVVKYILSYEHEECKTFLNYQSDKLISTLYHLAIGNTYHKIPEYQQNLNYLHSLI